MKQNSLITKLAPMTVGVMVAAALVLGPNAANAATLTNTQIGAVINLLTAFGVSSTTISSVQTVLTGADVSTSTTSVSGACATIPNDLHVGDGGEDVTKLQQFLSHDPSIYPEGLITGHFGPLTEKAVERYQETHSVVAPGAAGAGLVGPLTRGEINKEMEKECEQPDAGNADVKDQKSTENSNTSSESEASSTSQTQDHKSGDS